mgnify:CR=1 FL=1
MFSKNFLMSHFKTKQDHKLFLLIFRKAFSRAKVPLWFPFPIRQEKEFGIKVGSKIGARIWETA